MKRYVKKPLADQFLHIETDFLNAAGLRESEQEIADASLDLILKRERIRHGVTTGTKKAKAVDRQTIAKMITWDSNDPAMSTIEKALRRLASGRGGDAVSLIENSIAQREEQFIKRQKEKAIRPRPRAKSPLTLLVEEVISRNPKISTHDLFVILLEKIRGSDKPDYIYADGTFKSQNKRYPDVERGILRQYRQRAMKKILTLTG